MNKYDLERLDFVKVASIAVDSGQAMLMIVDPCYVLPDNRFDPNDLNKSYEDILNYYKETGFYENHTPETRDQERQGIEPWGGAMGYITSSGYGDGCYDVYARYEEKGMGRRVSQILVDFVGIASDDDGYDEEFEEVLDDEA